MNKFKITIVICLLMLLAVPYTDGLAVSVTSPSYTHFVYMMGHDGYIHYVINAWSLLVIHNLFRWYRVVTAYAFAVLVSYIALPDHPMVGASVFTCFFFGFTAPWLWRKERLVLFMTIALLLATCFLPGFAGIQHIAAFSFGTVFSLVEGYIHRIRRYLK